MAQKQMKVQLVKNGEILFSVFRLPQQNAEEIMCPADELVNYLTKSLGQKIPQYDKSCPVRLELKLDPFATLEDEEFIIDTSEKQITLTSGTVAAMFHAVYYFLENAIGIRWLWPGEDGEIVPKHENLSFSFGEIYEKPDFAWRAMQTKGAIYGDADGIDWSTMRHAILGLPLSLQNEFKTWCRRNRMGGINVADGHRWSEIAPIEKYGKSTPEFYALKGGKRENHFFNGKHKNQPCLSNEKVADIMADYACARFDKDSSLDVCSIALNDGSMECECEKCRDATYPSESVGGLEEMTNEFACTGRSKQSTSMTDLIFKNANNASKKIHDRFPDKKLLILLYSNSRFAPQKYSLDPNVIGQFCIMGNSLWNKGLMNEESKLLSEISKNTPELGIYEYYSNGKWQEIFRVFPKLIEKTINMYYDNGARYFSTQPGMGFAINGLNFYILAKMLWNRKEKADKLLDDYCTKGFESASSEIKKYFSALAKRWQETESATKITGQYPEWRLALSELYTEDFLKAREKELETAYKKSDDPEILKRISFLGKGLEYTQLYCDAIRKTSIVYQSVPHERLTQEQCSYDAIKYVPDKAINELKQALKAWDEYWRFVEKNMGKFVFGDYWVNYRPGVLGTKDMTISAMKDRLKRKEKGAL